FFSPLLKHREGFMRRLFRAFALILACACAVPALAAPLSPAHPLIDDMLYVDAARAGDRIVAVGDRGSIVWSDDDGRTWTMAVTPDEVLLTAVCFADENRGWAVGHDAVVLATTDGGKSWSRKYSDALGAEADAGAGAAEDD